MPHLRFPVVLVVALVIVARPGSAAPGEPRSLRSIASTPALRAQEAEPAERERRVFRVTPRLRVGERYRLHREWERVTEAGGEELHSAVVQDIDCEVVEGEGEEDGALVRWTLGEPRWSRVEHGDARPPRDDFVTGLVVDVRLDRQGQAAAVENADAVDAELRERLEEAEARAAAEGLSRIEIRRAYTSVRRALSSGTSTSRWLALAKDVHALSGFELTEGGARARNGVFGNPTGVGPPVAGRELVGLEEIAEDGTVLVCRYLREMDPESLRQATAGRARRVFDGLDLPEEELPETPEMSHVEVLVYRIELATGLPLVLERERAYAVGADVDAQRERITREPLPDAE